MTRERQDGIQGYVERLSSNNPNLTSISLSHEKITDVVIKDITSALKDNNTLTEIYFKK